MPLLSLVPPHIHQVSKSFALLLSAVLVGTLVLSGIQSPANGADFKWREPPYSNLWSNPWQGCVEIGLNTKYCARANSADGTARLFIRSPNNLALDFVQARHNVDPPVWQPFININQYRNLYFNSLMDGKFAIDRQGFGYQTTAEMRYGGWTTIYRTADATWVKDYYFYVAEDAEGEHNIDNTNVIFIKGKFAGKYGMGSLFDGVAGGDGTGLVGIVKAWDTSLGYGFRSWMLAIEWCDDGSCP